NLYKQKDFSNCGFTNIPTIWHRNKKAAYLFGKPLKMFGGEMNNEKSQDEYQNSIVIGFG
ncbi:MAG: hypothetical protein K2I87_05315, partial [Bacteroidales bacterium]|nr:hypothetical protein [Bacteroidales bacterium]